VQQTFRPLLSKFSKRRQIEVIYPHFEEVRGGVEPWLMARWKAHLKFLLSVIDLLFLFLTVEAVQGKMSQNSLPSGGGRSLGAKISGGRGRPPADILILLERQLIAYYQNYCIDSNQTLHSNKDHQMLFVGGLNTCITNPRWQMAAILEK